jgi:hypothetical protein
MVSELWHFYHLMTFYLMGMEPKQDMLRQKSTRKYISDVDEVLLSCNPSNAFYEYRYQ